MNEKIIRDRLVEHGQTLFGAPKQLIQFTKVPKADALTVLGRYPWYRLTPLFVHQDFIDPVLKAVVNLGGEKEGNRWRHTLERSKDSSVEISLTDNQ